MKPKQDEVLNLNATVPLRDYKQTAAKSLRKYIEILGVPFLTSIARLKEGDIVIDNGAGFGAAILELTHRLRVTSIAINAQNFWNDLRGLSNPDFHNLLFVTEKNQEERFVRVGSIFARDISTLGEAVGLEPLEFILSKASYENPKKMTEYRVRLKQYVKTLLAKVDDFQQKGRFEYHVGFSEKLMPLLFVKAKLIVDVFGAYYYSANRSLQLERIYQSLSSTGVALVVLGESNRVPMDYVIDHKGDRTLLLEFLVQRYPEQFFLVPPGRKSVPFILGKNELRLATPEDPPSLVHHTTAGTPLLLIKKTGPDSLTFPLSLGSQKVHYAGDPKLNLLYPDGVLFQEK